MIWMIPPLWLRVWTAKNFKHKQKEATCLAVTTTAMTENVNKVNNGDKPLEGKMHQYSERAL
jgi:hypothetical protein